MSLFRLQLIGPFCLFGRDGARIPMPSRKGAALLAMLAMSRGGERTRSWLQDRLWGTRQQSQAQASLRNELLKLRQHLNGEGTPLIVSEGDRVRIDLTQLAVDAHSTDDAFAGDAIQGHILRGEFLEGLDIPGEDGFEDWLREQRAAIAERAILSGATAAHSDSGVKVSNGPASLSATTFDARPSLAILPFADLTAGAENKYLTDGLCEELIDGVSRLRWIPVVAASSSIAYRDALTDPRAIAETLGVRYVLEGRMVGQADMAVLAFSLSDTVTGRIIWSHRLTPPSILSHATTDRLVRGLVSALDSSVDFAEQERALAKSAEDLTVTDMVWRARWHINRYTREDAAIASALIDRALAAQPNSSDALIQATYIRAWSAWTLRQSPEDIRDMRKLAERAIAADPLDGRAHMLAGLADLLLRRAGQARLLFEEAIRLNPSLCHAHALLGSSHFLDDRPADAIAPLERAIRLSPLDAQMFRVFGELAMSHFMLGNGDDACRHADQSLMRRPGYWYAHVVRINALVAKRDLTAARLARRELMIMKPQFSASNLDWLPFVDSIWNERLKDGLKQSE